MVALIVIAALTVVPLLLLAFDLARPKREPGELAGEPREVRPILTPQQSASLAAAAAPQPALGPRKPSGRRDFFGDGLATR